MKKTLYELFDSAEAAELQPLIKENAASLPVGVSLEHIKASVYQKTGLSASAKQHHSFRWLHIAALAACICIVAAGIWSVGEMRNAGALEGNNHGEEPGAPQFTVHSGKDAMEDFNSNVIIFGYSDPVSCAPDASISPSDPSDTQDATVDNRNEPVEYVQWNGITLSSELLEANYANSMSDVVFAVRAVSMAEPEVTLEDFVYNGTTYDELAQQIRQLQELEQDYCLLEDAASHWEEFAGTDAQEILYKLIIELGEDFVCQYYTDSQFDIEQIKADKDACAAELTKLNTQLQTLKAAYNGMYSKIADLTVLNRFGYYVIENNGSTFVFVTANELADLAQTLRTYNQDELLNDIVFTLATRSEVGYFEPDEPDLTTDEPLPEAE